MEAGLHDLCLQRSHFRQGPGINPAPRSRSNTWRAWPAAAAGLVLGLLSASVGFGLGVRSPEQVIPLLRESFEQGQAPRVKGVPEETGPWSGDFSEIVAEHSGVQPADGKKMARLLRSDYVGRTIPKPSRQGDLMRALDVRPEIRQAHGGDVVLTLHALFNTAPFPATERYDGMVTIYALGAGTSLAGATEDSIREEALAFSIGECRYLDRDTATWQPASTQLLLPATTETVLLKISFRRAPLETQTLSELPDALVFSGHYVDDIRASIRIRPASFK
jgi:hypothetical protein